MANTTAIIGTMASSVLYVSAAAFCITRFVVKKRIASSNFFRTSSHKNFRELTSSGPIFQMSFCKNRINRFISLLLTFFFSLQKESSAPISRVLYPYGRLSFIYYAGYPASLASYPPSCSLELGRTILNQWYTRTCSLQTEQPCDHPQAGGLLHHLLTLTPLLRRLFSSPVSCCYQQLVLSPVECPLLPGLSSRTLSHASDRPLHCFQYAKVRISERITKFI